jgi:hypothetical protein
MVEVGARVGDKHFFGGCVPGNVKILLFVLGVIVLFVKHYSSI